MKQFFPIRITYLILIAFTIGLGLLSRSSLIDSTSFIGKYSGDTLWAAVVYWGFALLFYKNTLKRPLKYSLLFAYSIELTQFNKEPWLMELRATGLGALILGHDFVFTDLLCYTVGIGIASLVDYYHIRRTVQVNQQEE